MFCRFGLVLGIFFLLAGCAGSQVSQSTPISSKRGVEVLEFGEGEIPHWRKAGSLTVKPGEESEQADQDSSSESE